MYVTDTTRKNRKANLYIFDNRCVCLTHILVRTIFSRILTTELTDLIQQLKKHHITTVGSINTINFKHNRGRHTDYDGYYNHAFCNYDNLERIQHHMLSVLNKDRNIPEVSVATAIQVCRGRTTFHMIEAVKVDTVVDSFVMKVHCRHSVPFAA